MGKKFEREVLDNKYDDGTMLENVDKLEDTVVGHKIVSAERVPKSVMSEYSGKNFHDVWIHGDEVFVITLDDETVVVLGDTDDCCAYTELESFLLNVKNIDHVITGVRTENKYCKWFIYADFGDILEMNVGWSPGNPFYYAYGFEIIVIEPIKRINRA